MRTSGHGRGDGLMSAVPIAILVVFVVGIAGGLKPTLRTIELAMWSAVDWIASLIS
jgi:hypothetical protein